MYTISNSGFLRLIEGVPQKQKQSKGFSLLCATTLLIATGVRPEDSKLSRGAITSVIYSIFAWCIVILCSLPAIRQMELTIHRAMLRDEYV